MMVVTNKVVFLSILAGLLLATNYVAAVDYMVGDDEGWTLNFDYQTWAMGKIFRVGDRLVFKYPRGKHSVVKVNGTDFMNCVKPVVSLPLTSGNDIIELRTPGKKYYICGVEGHCSMGQKLAINVMMPSNMASSPVAALAPVTAALPPWFRWFPVPVTPSPSYYPGSDNADDPIPLPPALPALPIGRLPYIMPTSPAATPGYEFPWRKIFDHLSPPAAAPAPGFEFPWKEIFSHLHSPVPAPAPGFEFPWKEIFSHLHPPSPSPSVNDDAAEDFSLSESNAADASRIIPSRMLSSLSDAAAAPGFEFPWKEIFSHLHSPTPAPAPGYEFPWKEIFTHLHSPTPAPAPGYDFPWKEIFTHLHSPAPAPTPGYEFPWKEIFTHLHSPTPAPAPDFPWKEIFTHLHSPAPAPTPGYEFPWKEIFSHLSPSPSPSYDVALPPDWWHKFFSHLPKKNPSPSPSPSSDESNAESPWSMLIPPRKLSSTTPSNAGVDSNAASDLSTSGADWLTVNVAQTALMVSFAIISAVAVLV